MKSLLSSKRTGWSANALFVIMFFFVIFVIMASFMPTMQNGIENGVSQVEGGGGGTLLKLIFFSVPILLVLMGLYALIIGVVNR